MKNKLVIYWSRRDFRLNDNPALVIAIKYSKDNNIPLLPLFILEDYMCKAGTEYQIGYSQRVILSKSLPHFISKFENFLLLRGKGANTLIKISKYYDIKIFVNEDVYIDFYKQIEKIKRNNIDINILEDQLTIKKDTVNGTGGMYNVFTPFKKAVWSEFLNTKVLNKINTSDIKYQNNSDYSEIKKNIILENIRIIEEVTEENILEEFSKNKLFKAGNKEYDIDILLPKTHIDFSVWDYDEDLVIKNFEFYLKKNLENYNNDRDSLEKDLTSKMSMPLSWGLISARMLKDKIIKHFDYNFENVFKLLNIQDDKKGAVQYLSELIWREFYKYLMYRKPELMNTEFQEKFQNSIEWLPDNIAHYRFEKWIKGETGYKVVDAAMMQLAKTGWMHNRSRMIVASVLTKNLGVDWRWGQEYFRAMLIDLDEASNNGGWQWGASVGADPKPIRIFNPYLQAENYDKSGIYQKKWLSDEQYYFELSPIIEHKVARDEALKRYKLDKDKTIARDY